MKFLLSCFLSSTMVPIIYVCGCLCFDSWLWFLRHTMIHYVCCCKWFFVCMISMPIRFCTFVLCILNIDVSTTKIVSSYWTVSYPLRLFFYKKKPSHIILYINKFPFPFQHRSTLESTRYALIWSYWQLFFSNILFTPTHSLVYVFFFLGQPTPYVH